MSRVHDALRKVTQDSPDTVREPIRAPVYKPEPPSDAPDGDSPRPAAHVPVSTGVLVEAVEPDMRDVIRTAKEIPFTPASDSLLVNPSKPREAPAEEFRSLRTRLNHLQTLQPLHTLVVTSASPAEGKSFTAANLAIAQSQLADKRVLLADFDFRRPSVDKTFQIDCSPGITDYLTGRASLSSIMRKVAGTNLYILTAGDAVPNPLELLNLKECKALIGDLRDQFDWVILDSPPLLFAADGNLLATMCDGTILVVRIGATTFDAVTRAMQSLCENNVLGVVVNGARRGELYSKYSYYHDYYTPETEDRRVSGASAVPAIEGADSAIESK
ncbi:MAG TPA: CpsD/CapB family tyrosine-protein kinase [Bryobacteraceae bacterium]|nr:CpsD/CapB family tyrosine-protein kinase [Bryobacteraceae bacterium]